MCRACGVKKLALVNHPSYPAVVQGSCKRKPELQKKHDFENNISRLSHDLWFNSQLRNSHRAQDCTIKSVRTMRLNLPEKLDTISKNWAKVAGHQLHPSSWHTTLQANLAGEQEKKIRAASSSTPQTAQRPFAGPLLAATFKLREMIQDHLPREDFDFKRHPCRLHILEVGNGRSLGHSGIHRTHRIYARLVQHPHNLVMPVWQVGILYNVQDLLLVPQSSLIQRSS
jgi:hypothetical protein